MVQIFKNNPWLSRVFTNLPYMKKDQNANYNRRKFITTSAKAFAAFTIVPRFVLGGKMPDGTLYTAPSDMINLGFIGTGKQGRGLPRPSLKPAKYG
jgi:hypothetical protein